jgi:DNA polymerase-3 subunit delta'
MPIHDRVGQHQAKKMLFNALTYHRVSHAYLFYGPKGTGKVQMALSLAQALFCMSPAGDGDACGGCVNCRRIEHGNHPDVYRVEPDGASIKIEQIRQLQKDTTYRASESKRKVYIIENAEKLTPQAANSLLKFLEEPSPGVTAILTTDHRHALLPTVLSRVQLVPFYPFTREEMKIQLAEEAVPEPIIQIVSQMMVGLEEGKQLCHSESFAHVRSVVIQLMKETMQRSTYALISLHEKWFKADRWEDQMDIFLDLIICWLRDLVHIKSHKTNLIVYIDHLSTLQQQAIQWSFIQIVQAMEHVVDTKKRLRAHANAQLTLERLFIKLQEG